MSIPDRTTEEINQLAIDIYRGLVFTSAHIANDPDTIARVFSPLMMMDSNSMNHLVDSDPGLLYEYIDKAGPRSINGNPQFFSFSMINRDDTKRVFDAIDRIKKAVESGIQTKE